MTPPSPAPAESVSAERKFTISAPNREILRNHAINLRDGRLIPSGALHTSQEDVERLFRETLVSAYKDARKENRPFHLLFFAHGGTVTEESAVGQALAHVPMWREAGIYPVFFIWETEVKNAIRDALRGRPRDRGLGDIFGGIKDKVVDGSDWSLEKVARLARGEHVWGEMKKYARRGVEPQRGGSWLVAKELADFIGRDEVDKKHVQVHCLGHSAGAVFHSWFIPALLGAGVPAVDSLHFLAPAVTTDLFKRQLLKHVGRGIKRFTTFTLDEETELADSVAKVYRKSLLYMISRALEPEVPTPILGLEESIRADKDLRTLYNYPKGLSAKTDLIFSPNHANSDRGTRSIAHGGFGNEPYTLNSIVRRITGDAKLGPFPADFQSRVKDLDADPGERLAPSPGSSAPRRRALCIGIDDYADAPLDGCVNDARLWQETFTALGFDSANLLINEQASYQGMLHAMEELILASRPGDALVIQFAGHGTQVPDINGDEAEQSHGDSLDEALVPYDYEGGQFIIDDDLARVFNKLPAGVGLTCFMDCCHSGGNTRLWLGGPSAVESGEKERFLSLKRDGKIVEAFLKQRRSRAAERARAPENMREVAFAACQPEQTAKEKDGHGYFTLTATRLLSAGQSMTNDDFLSLLIRDFPLKPDSQKPHLHCPDGSREQPLFAIAATDKPLPGTTSNRLPIPASQASDARLLIETMHRYMENLETLLSRES